MIEPASMQTLWVPSPNPMADNRVDDGTNEDRNEEVAAKAHSFRDGAGDDRGGRSTKRQLEKKEGPQMNLGTPIEQKLVGPDEAKRGDPKHESIAQGPKYDRGETDIHDIFNRHIDAVFSTDQSRFQTGKPCLHEQNERCAG